MYYIVDTIFTTTYNVSVQTAAHGDELSDCLPNKHIECDRDTRKTSTNKIFFRDGFFLLHQDVPHGLDELETIISPDPCVVSTCVALINPPSSTKPNSGATGTAIGPMVTNNPPIHSWRY